MTTDFIAGKCLRPLEGANESVRLSVVVPIFNGLDCLGECLGSVLRQLPADCECIAVDDGSDAATVSALKDFVGGLMLSPWEHPAVLNFAFRDFGSRML